MDDPRDREMAEAVCAYLAEHPGAMDTLEGIAGWWLMRQRVRADLDRLERVLGRMVDSGVLETVGSTESPRYHLRRAPPGEP
jgi:hypothetical protein